MIEGEVEQQQQSVEKLPIEQLRWIGGSTLTENFEDIYDLDEFISQ